MTKAKLTPPLETLAPGALEGIRVLDVADSLGALISRLFGDLGADVIKIEPPGGEPGRDVSPFIEEGSDRLSLPFIRANVNKRSAILDLSLHQDQERFRGLVERADIVVSTEGIKTWATRGIDLTQLSALYPRLIWLSFSPFGLTGPYSSYLSNHIVSEAMGGLSYIQGDDAKPPCMSPCGQGIYLSNIQAAFGALMALWERRTSGQGQLVETAVHEVLTNLYFLIVNYGLWSDIPYRIGTSSYMPPNGYYPCQDGHIFIAALMQGMWDKLVNFIDDPRLKDPALTDADYRNEHPELFDPILREFTAKYDRWTLMTELQKHGVPAAPWSNVADIAANDHLQARDFFLDFEQPPFGRIRNTGPMFRSSASPSQIRRPAPRPGEHNQEVFAEIDSQPKRALATSVNSTHRRLPLDGIRVLDLSRAWAGPYGTRYLADYGADVIKVETGKFPPGREPGSPSYGEVNRNKRPITLNFQLPEGRELLKRLVSISDVVVENFSPRVMDKYGVNYDQLLEVRPDLIMVSLPGYGKKGPHGQFISFGGPLMAYTGMSLLWGYPDSPPDARVKIAQPDYISSTTQAFAITAALHHREHTGTGQHIEIAQVEAAIAALEPVYLDYFVNGTIAEPMGNRDPNAVPQGCYPCLGNEAWCVISCTTETQWRAMATVIGEEEWAADPKFASTADRWARHDEIDDQISARTREWTPYQLMRELQAAGVPAGVMQTAEDIWRDPQLRSRNYTVQIEHPDLGVVEHPGMTVRLHQTPGQIQRPVGRLGEANDAVFRGLLGLSSSEISRLAESGVIA